MRERYMPNKGKQSIGARVTPVNGSGKVVARIAPNEEEGCENREQDTSKVA